MKRFLMAGLVLLGMGAQPLYAQYAFELQDADSIRTSLMLDETKFAEAQWACSKVDDAGYGVCARKSDDSILYDVASKNGVDYQQGGEIVGVKVASMKKYKEASLAGVAYLDSFAVLSEKVLKSRDHRIELSRLTNEKGQPYVLAMIGDYRVKNADTKESKKWLWSYILDEQLRVIGFELSRDVPYV